ncbi:MAG: response regulator [Roseburia sp.]|jgi:PAS domain S-box-containing protein|nr:response regulator [Roseburia sp.]
MYRCHILFYLAGEMCRAFEQIKALTPLEFFTHEFLESAAPEVELSSGADVIFANTGGLKAGQAAGFLNALISERKKGSQLILLAEKRQIPELSDALPEAEDLWVLPETEEEFRFRLNRWQQGYKMKQDFWQTSHFLDATINNVPNLIWYKDKNGIHEKVNDSFCRTVNKTKEQVEGRGHAYIWDVEEDDPACIESENEVMRKQKTFVSEEIIKAGTGMRTLTTYKSPLYDIDGSVMGTVGVAIDVTQERAYEQEIINKNRTHETIFTTIDCGVMRHTIDGTRVISINRAALRILGYESVEELMEAGFDTVADSVFSEDKPRLKESIHQLRKEGDSVSVEYRVQHKNGDMLHVMGNVKLLMEDGELFYQRFLLDCTDQKQEEKEKEMRQIELVHALTIDYSFVCFFDLGTGKGSVLRNDDENGRMFGSAFEGENTFETGMERYIEEFVYEEDRKLLRQVATLERVQQELLERSLIFINYRTVLDDGVKYFQMKLVGTGAKDKGHGLVLGIHSVDEEMRSEMEKKSMLEDALFQANKASRAKSEFLSNMSHDIRTPMNAIVGFTSLAIAHIDEKEQVTEYLSKIITSGNHLLNLINDVLDMSRIESGRMHLEEKPCTLTELIGELHNILQADISAKQQTLLVESDVRSDDIFCDVLRLNQVLLNLLGNSVKYTEDGGTIRLQLTEKSGAAAGYGNYEFRISDNGIGMSKEFVTRIFEPFEREKNATASGIQGTGLGMAITKNIVDMMHGSIEVESEQGKGTEFIVSFSFRLNQQSGSQQDTAEGKKKTDGEPMVHHTGHILLAEDIELNQEIAVAILGDAGFTTDVAGNGQIALEMLRKSEPGFYKLVLMDVQMPVMNGYEATREIRRLPDQKLAKIPIIAMTANAFEEDRQEALRCGMNGHIAKPIDVVKLFETLDEILS